MAKKICVLTGPDKGRQWVLIGPEVLLGHDAYCQIRLADRRISARLRLRVRADVVRGAWEDPAHMRAIGAGRGQGENFTWFSGERLPITPDTMLELACDDSAVPPDARDSAVEVKPHTAAGLFARDTLQVLQIAFCAALFLGAGLLLLAPTARRAAASGIPAYEELQRQLEDAARTDPDPAWWRLSDALARGRDLDLRGWGGEARGHYARARSELSRLERRPAATGPWADRQAEALQACRRFLNERLIELAGR